MIWEVTVNLNNASPGIILRPPFVYFYNFKDGVNVAEGGVKQDQIYLGVKVIDLLLSLLEETVESGRE